MYIRPNEKLKFISMEVMDRVSHSDWPYRKRNKWPYILSFRDETIFEHLQNNAKIVWEKTLSSSKVTYT